MLQENGRENVEECRRFSWEYSHAPLAIPLLITAPVHTDMHAWADEFLIRSDSKYLSGVN